MLPGASFEMENFTTTSSRGEHLGLEADADVARHHVGDVEFGGLADQRARFVEGEVFGQDLERAEISRWGMCSCGKSPGHSSSILERNVMENRSRTVGYRAVLCRDAKGCRSRKYCTLSFAENWSRTWRPGLGRCEGNDC